MDVEFKSSPKRTLGVEIELQLVDRESFDLSSRAQEVLEITDKHPELFVKHELTQSMLEIETEICSGVQDVDASLRRQMTALLKQTEEIGLELAMAGTHPFQSWWERKVFPTARLRQIFEKFQWLARRMTIFGIHVHVGIESGERAIQIINHLVNYIPHLLALSASSPFYGGRDTGLQSARVGILESFPTGGLPYFFPNWQEFQNYFSLMTYSGAIHSIKDIYWDVRPHYDFGTVEVRVCDGLPTVKGTMSLVALIYSLVVWLDQEIESGSLSPVIDMRHYWIARENKWQAARYGLEGRYIRLDKASSRTIKEETEKLLKKLQPMAVSLNCENYFSGLYETIKNGTSSDRQREIFAKTASLPLVVNSLVNDLKQDLQV